MTAKRSKLLQDLVQWDERVFLKVRGFGGKKNIIIMRFFTFFGRESIWSFLISYFLVIFIDLEKFSLFANALLVGLILVNTTKLIVRRKRPYERLENLPPLEKRHKTSSFPSWHTYNATANALIIGYLTGLWWVYLIFLLISVGVGLSRVQLGVHYPLDSIVGYLYGIIGFPLILQLRSMWTLFFDWVQPFLPFTIVDKSWNVYLGEWWHTMIIVLVYGWIFISSIYDEVRITKQGFKIIEQKNERS